MRSIYSRPVFSVAEIDEFISLPFPEEEGDPRGNAVPVDIKKRTQFGDLWRLGDHLLFCGDSTNQEIVEKLLTKERARMVFTDPPYNVPVDGHVGGNGKVKHPEFEMASGEMCQEQFTDFLRASFRNLVNASLDGAIHFICMDWRHVRELQNAAEDLYSELKNLIVWVKDSGGMGSFYRSRHELIFVFKVGSAPHINSFELGQHGRYRTNVWEYRSAQLSELHLHPTVKPVEMIADAIRDASVRGEIVLDLFGGSGSTLIAAHKTGRRARLCEISPDYCDIILYRWERYASDVAVLSERDGKKV